MPQQEDKGAVMAISDKVCPIAEWVSKQIGVPLNRIRSVQYRSVYDSFSIITV